MTPDRDRWHSAFGVTDLCVSFLPRDADALRHSAAVSSGLRDAVFRVHGPAVLQARVLAVRQQERARRLWATMTVLASTCMALTLVSASPLAVLVQVPWLAALSGVIITGVLRLSLTDPGVACVGLVGLAAAMGDLFSGVPDLLPLVLVLAGTDPLIDHPAAHCLRLLADACILACTRDRAGQDSPDVSEALVSGLAARATVLATVVCALSPRWLDRLVRALARRC